MFIIILNYTLQCYYIYLCFSTYVPPKISKKIIWGRQILRFLHYICSENRLYLKRTDFGKEIDKRDREFR